MAAQKANRNGDLPVIIAGGGIGGLAAALTLARTGHAVRVLEQASEFSEIGAGLQLGPNAGRLLRKWGVHELLEPDLVAPQELRMMDGVSDEVIGQIPLGQAFVERFGAPYYVAHRGDLHRALHTACKGEAAISLEAGAAVEDYEQTAASVTVRTRDGRSHAAACLIGADGLWSKIRGRIVGDGPPNFANHTTYRTLLEPDEMPADCAWNAATLWAGPNTHLVHYPISGRRHYNIVATVCSDWHAQGWNEPADKDELLWFFRKGCERVKRILQAGTSYRKWAIADRTPAARWSDGRVTLLGDAAHAVLQYFAQGAAMAIEDADCLATSLQRHVGDPAAAFLAYEAARRPRTARLQRESRYLGTVYHARGIKRFFRNRIMRRQTPEDWYSRVSWVYSGP
jgi:salicylate hydroxylase